MRPIQEQLSRRQARCAPLSVTTAPDPSLSSVIRAATARSSNSLSPTRVGASAEGSRAPTTSLLSLVRQLAQAASTASRTARDLRPDPLGRRLNWARVGGRWRPATVEARTCTAHAVWRPSPPRQGPDEPEAGLVLSIPASSTRTNQAATLGVALGGEAAIWPSWAEHESVLSRALATEKRLGRPRERMGRGQASADTFGLSQLGRSRRQPYGQRGSQVSHCRRPFEWRIKASCWPDERLAPALSRREPGRRPGDTICLAVCERRSRDLGRPSAGKAKLDCDQRSVRVQGLSACTQLIRSGQ